MKARINTGALVLALLLAACGEEGGNLGAAAANNAAPIEPIAAPNNGDWRETVAVTPEGGFRMGNPDAPVKLVEYASLTCPHCAAFSEEGTAALRDTYVRSGRVSWEYRSLLLSGPDLAMTVLARCQAPGAFFPTIEQLFAQQREILSGIDESEGARIEALPPEQQIAPLARAMDLDTFFARRGMPESRFSACLGDPQNVQRVTDMTNHAMQELQVSQTPTFIINGERQQADRWSNLEPLLRAAIGG